MRMKVYVGALTCLALAWGAGVVKAQDGDFNTLPAPLPHDDVPYSLDSGLLDNLSDEHVIVWSQTITLQDHVSMRLHFSQSSLPEGSFIRVTSAFDMDDQALDGYLLNEWSNSTAYFNGNTLILDLYAAPRTTGNRIVVSHVEAALSPSDAGTGGNGECGICNGDDRTASSQDWSGRIMSVGCSGTIWNTNSCVVSAGHCRSGGVIQFRVPASNGNCSTNNPPAADQFPISGGGQSRNAGVGADWWVTTTSVNANGQKPFDRYGVFMQLAAVDASVGQAAEIYGFGVDTTCARSQTQQLSTGSISVRSGTHYEYSNDVRGGNSGSGLLVGGKLVGVVTHCSTGGCPNYGTKHTNADFKAARDAVCPGGGGGVPCADVKRLRASCRTNGTIKGKVIMTDSSHNGETVTVSIDGTMDLVLTINADRAPFSQCCFSGNHTVSLKNPANCASVPVSCP